MNAQRERTPARRFLGVPCWVWLTAFALALTQPLIALWIAHGAPQGMEPTGLHIQDSALFLYSMHMFDTGFDSHYATCKAAAHQGIFLFPVPHLWLYGAWGAATQWTGLSDFTRYAIANGLGAFLYLIMAYWFLRQALPKCTGLAFLLFSLGGGLGGILYILSGILGLHSAPEFEDLFRRFALYELFEGPHLLPFLHFPRCYYTVSLGLGLGAFAAMIQAHRAQAPRFLLLTAGLIVPAAFINMRYGIFIMGAAILYLLSQNQTPRAQRLRMALAMLLPGLIGALIAWALLRTNPAVIENHHLKGNVAMWLSPFITTACFHLLILPFALWRRMRGLVPWQRILAFAGLGYLALFGGLFAAYQFYYGNILVARDGAVAAIISDWALIGAALGAAFALITLRRGPAANRDWLLLWFLGYLAVSISAFGQGWFLRYGPQRIEVLLWLPLCMLTASALAQMPRLAKPGIALLCTGGICSIAVSAACFQGPLGYQPGKSPYAQYHCEWMTSADALTMQSIGPGTVLAPIPASDIFALSHGNDTVFGTGSFNLTDQSYLVLEDAALQFFSPETDPETRRAIVQEWCVDWVYCPDTWTIPPETTGQLRQTPWLEQVATQDQAALFKVRK